MDIKSPDPFVVYDEPIKSNQLMGFTMHSKNGVFVVSTDNKPECRQRAIIVGIYVCVSVHVQSRYHVLSVNKPYCTNFIDAALKCLSLNIPAFTKRKISNNCQFML